ncbi:hydroxyacid oxidase 1 [Caerostris extrusa]|uniref:Hydroxyacid oxidase 1 n=1 Tax=Caerostris extrusa TaxID=172846 RepID=A0AAV4PQ18_CAEEX|nr:hydroxyacid oxidase 1 [Caerostris extrusa]
MCNDTSTSSRTNVVYSSKLSLQMNCNSAYSIVSKTDETISRGILTCALFIDKLDLVTVDDYDRCGPAKLSLEARNYFLAAAGRRITYKRNKDAFDRLEIIPRMLRDVSKNSLETSTLGQKVDFQLDCLLLHYTSWLILKGNLPQ